MLWSILNTRTIGLGHKLFRETLEHAGTPYVETVAVIAKYNPFFEKAGMTKIQETQPAPEAIAIRDILADLGFNTTLFGSEKYALSKLATLTDSELLTVKQAFKQHTHLRFMKEFFYHLPYGKKEAFKTCMDEASLEKLAKLIHVTALLLQTKVYLFWRKKGKKKVRLKVRLSF